MLMLFYITHKLLEIIKLVWWWWIVFAKWLTNERHLALFPAGTTVRDSHHHKSLTPLQLDLSLCRDWVQGVILMKLCCKDKQFNTVITNHSFYLLSPIPPFVRGGAQNQPKGVVARKTEKFSIGCFFRGVLFFHQIFHCFARKFHWEPP